MMEVEIYWFDGVVMDTTQPQQEPSSNRKNYAAVIGFYRDSNMKRGVFSLLMRAS